MAATLFWNGQAISYWPLNRVWKRDPAFYFYSNRLIVCPATGPGDLKFIIDSLPLFGLTETFLIAKSEASMMGGDAMPHEMNKLIKSFCSTPLKTTPGFEMKLTISDSASVFFFCFFDNCKRQFASGTCVYFQLQSEI